MPRPRSYRHDIRCIHCGSNWIVNNGKDRGKQTVFCRECKTRHTPSAKRHWYSKKFREQAVKMYENGNSGRAVARILGVSPSAVYSWIKKKAEWAQRLREARKEDRLKRSMAKAISIDEMWTYHRALRGPGRKIVWIWTAVIEWLDGSRSFDFVIGDHKKETFQKLMARLPLAETYHTDAYPVYREFSRRHHVVGKGGKVNWNEGIHSRLRDGLYRLRRRTKGPTRSLWMLEASVALIAIVKGFL